MHLRRSAPLTRRAALRLFGAGAGLAVGGPLLVRSAFASIVDEEVQHLKPGQYSWHPELSPDGPVDIIVSLPEQLCHVYRNGIQIAVTTVSTGKPGFATPTGVFTILQKDKVHHSSTYDEASMPYSERLTWSGVALHAGGLPGYPSSHGCIHLPLAFSEDLYTITQVGTPVIIAGASTAPTNVTHPGMVLGQYADSEFDKVVSSETHEPESDETPHYSVIVSSASKQIDVINNGNIVASGAATIDDPSKPLGENVFVLNGTDASTRSVSWHAITYSRDTSQPLSTSDPNTVIRRIHGADAVVNAIKSHMDPGLILVTTDLPITPDSRSGNDFVVMDTGGAG